MSDTLTAYAQHVYDALVDDLRAMGYRSHRGHGDRARVFYVRRDDRQAFTELDRQYLAELLVEGYNCTLSPVGESWRLTAVLPA